MTKTIFFILFSIFSILAFTQDIPEKPKKERLVNDFAQILSSEEIASLESQLINFEDSTSNQICIVTVKSLNGYDKAEFAYTLGEKWGVGQKDFNNGIVILVKPKYDEDRGQAFIATGYGLEGVLPDATTKKIVEYDMIPEFKKGNYYQGIQNAVNTVIAITKGEYTADNYSKKSDSNRFITIIVIIIIIFLISKVFSKGNKNNNSGRTGGGMWYGGSSSSSWGSFSSGGGSFGGFGGGSFGGGGAGGSW